MNKTVKISNLKEGDTFIYKGVLYEVWYKQKWSTCCVYLNDKYRYGDWHKYLYCDFSNYTKVEI
jgi:hypothetical protein